jgi:uncharacterized protein (DUF1499 family)
VKSDGKLSIKSIDENLHYMRAEGNSVVPPAGIDDVEFFMPFPQDRKIFYRYSEIIYSTYSPFSLYLTFFSLSSLSSLTFSSNSRDVVALGPQSVVGDAGSNRNRLERVKKNANLIGEDL